MAAAKKILNNRQEAQGRRIFSEEDFFLDIYY